MLTFFLKQIYRYRTGLTALKYFSDWKVSMHPTSSSVKDEQPWISYKAIDVLKKILNKNSIRRHRFFGGTSHFSGTLFPAGATACRKESTNYEQLF